jgi:diaminohydroxyphosphoribosylaminopyrimidine deaminase/5-amino-6-(5-phosphoribosylamino)uracil reductase
MKTNPDLFFLQKTLDLARKSEGLTSPNPMVAALIVKGRRILSSGRHRAFGLPHAEIEALQRAGAKAKGATLYVNLEPCCYWGKTPPCTDAIISAGIKEVVACTEDPNPEVSGKGFEFLKKAGIKVRVGLLEPQARKLNESFFTNFSTNLPFVGLKWAMSLDGKLATEQGHSKWITCEEARKKARRIRFLYDAIAVGIGTVLADNPSLDWESPPGAAPQQLLEKKRYWKIIFDTHGKTPPGARIFENQNAQVLLFIGENAPCNSLWPTHNTSVIRVPIEKEECSLPAALAMAKKEGIGKIMVEGGTRLLTSFWKSRTPRLMHLFIGTKIIGGRGCFVPIEGETIQDLSHREKITITKHLSIGSDLYIEARPCFPE